LRRDGRRLKKERGWEEATLPQRKGMRGEKMSIT
jgi:hypothetical protein